MAEKLILYDIASSRTDQAWNAKCWKVRYTLNYKGLSYKTIWVEYSDIADACKSLGVAPTGVRDDGGPLYTLPMLHDPNTHTALSESLDIALYLERTYPRTPPLFPDGTVALIAAFDVAWSATVERILIPIGISKTVLALNPPSAEYIRRTRVSKPDEVSPPGPKRDEHWRLAREGFTTVAGWLTRNEAGGPHVVGTEMTYADIIIGSLLVGFKVTFGKQSKEWLDICTWDDGRWGALMKTLEKFEETVV